MSARIRVDWPACRAHGLCHELLPDLVRLDEWGFPVITAELPPERRGEALTAVRACPRMALRITDG